MSVAEEVGGLELAREPAVPSGRLRDALSLLLANNVAVAGLVLTVVFVIVGAIGAVVLLTPSLHHLYLEQDLANTLQPPSAGHWLGTDQLGRDILWRAVAGTGIGFLIGLEVAIIVMAIGLVLGAIAGYFGGVIDMLIVGLIDLVWGFPLLLIAVLIAGAVGKGLTAVALAVGFVLWAGFARIVRAQVRSLREKEFTEAARMLGVRPLTIVRRHMIPNVTGTAITMATYYVAVTVIAEAGFSFIGLGAQAPTPSLGSMIAEGRSYWLQSVWPTVVPGAMICLIVLGLNCLGDGLRDIFDPRLRKR